ncbi:hypothetical protein cypCar_00002250 [Cyprinus carpio]|nr:hypothetical protein cypCar_00002250 [Cyprinus carpio]
MAGTVQGKRTPGLHASNGHHPSRSKGSFQGRS